MQNAERTRSTAVRALLYLNYIKGWQSTLSLLLAIRLATLTIRLVVVVTPDEYNDVCLPQCSSSLFLYVVAAD